MENRATIHWDILKKEKTKIAKNVLNALNYDIADVFIIDDKTFYISKVCSYSNIPEYVYKKLKQIYKKLGYIYLYDL